MPPSMSLQPLLRQPYVRDTYRTILEDILPSGTLQIFQAPQTIVATCDDVKSTVQLGTLELPDGNTVALLEVNVADQVKLARNRVALRNFVASFLKDPTWAAVIAVFHQQGRADWRLTYASKRARFDDDTLEITSTQTAPRRYTFLLGQNEPCKTAASRLAELREKDVQLTLEDVERAFSIERLNIEFFDLYRAIYTIFVSDLLPDHENIENAKHPYKKEKKPGKLNPFSHLIPALDAKRAAAIRAAFDITTQKDKAEQDKADKPVRDFVKRLLGRLVFLHFLQKKGWMGCKAGGKSWTGGDADFLASYFSLAESKKQADQFHSRWLIPLFFEALNQPDRTGDLFPPTGTRIPYLNGGLFETDPAPLHALDFPAEHFRALLDFFGQYHFTIDENDPEDHEVGIDPEMLGHIFENLLEDNKDKGAYYTPKAIVAYMARQSLLHYLQTHLGENAELSVLLNEKDFTRLEKNGFVHQHAKRIEELLDAVKICDPAIGSGAFPIGLLQEILWTRLTLDLTLNTPEERARLKRRIIQNSIHGVDLDPGAVEIARLRFWLALVVDEDQPRPLPNLDYKIHRADSLIEYIRGEPVHLGKVNAADKRTHGAIQSLITAKAALFTAQKLPEKRAARFALYRALAEVAIAEFIWLRNEMGLIAGDAERAAQLDNGLKEFSHRLELINNAAKLKAEHQDRRLDELRAWFDDDQKPTFLWQLHFGEVYAKGGFDIVIANPPYFDVKGMDPLVKAEIFARYDTSENRINLYSTFVHLAHESLVSRKGCIAFVIPNSLLHGESYQKLRRRLVSKISEIIKLPDSVFPTATVETILLFTASGICNTARTHVFANNERFTPEIRCPTATDKRVWLQDANCRFILGQDTKKAQLVSKIRKGGTELKEGYETCLGITPYDKAKGHTPHQIKSRVFHSSTKLNTQYVPLVEGGNFGRGYLRPDIKEWLRYGDHLGAPRESRFFEAPRVIVRQILGREHPRIVSCYTDKTIYHTQIAFAIISRNKDKESEGKYLSALFQSRTLNFYHESVFIDREKVVFPKALIANFKQLPIPPASDADKARLGQLAEACAAAAQRGDDETLAVHEAEIDEIVYRLFDLTEEEIALIESALAPTRGAAPARKRTRAIRPAAASDAGAYEFPPSNAETLVQETPPAPQPAPAPAWLPGELFNVEGELPAAKKAWAAPEAATHPKTAGKLRSPEGNARITSEPKATAPVPVDEIERADVLAVIREVFSSGGERDRETARREIAQALGHERVGSRIREVLDTDIRTAVRRGILQNEGGQLSLHCRGINDYDRAFLKELFLAAINQNGKVWLERDEAIRLFARWLGFRRAGSIIQSKAASLMNGLIREGLLETDGAEKIRRR